MGLGKTITLISLILAHPNNKLTKTITLNNKVKQVSKATLILCPSHIVKQLEHEIKRCNNNLKTISIVNRSDYNKLSYDDFIYSDITITSFQFVGNLNYYLTLNYEKCTKRNFNILSRMENINKTMDTQSYIEKYYSNV